MASTAVFLRNEGNRSFLSGDYVVAEALYSQAILSDPQNSALYTNRALARLKLELWDEVVTDTKTCLDRSPDNMKAHYILSQAEFHLKDYDSAIYHCRRAHELCVAAHDRSLIPITNHMLECKRARWTEQERRRQREVMPLEAEMVSLLEKDKKAAVEAEEDEQERAAIAADYDDKLKQLGQVFILARNASAETARRDVPEWVVDDMTFTILVDPVMTKTGKSYERAAILEHLHLHGTDPITREPLSPDDLRPNLGLRAACEEFLDNNGWAVDW
ncbi:hypothetical protein SEPCBS119000_005392 [Sporothrix epigloea]|uniref:U-box domain-containing protein n=1 Tax=Sporothrix epigloea TaxID=1892477 RepID=A0ABP0DXC0_9PEZI